MKIQIKNFCNLEDVYLELEPGITCIIGPSNSGKSALTQAIRSLIYNKHSDSKVMQGKTSYMVGIQDGENQVLCKRNKSNTSKTSYQVNGNLLTKVGRNSLPEVQDVLNIKDIEILKSKTEMNFVKQFAYPFLLDKTPSQLYDFLASSDTSDDLNAILKDMKSDLKEIVDNQKRLEGSIDAIKSMHEKELVRYNNLVNSDLVVNSILLKAGEVNSLKSSKNLLDISDTCSVEIDQYSDRLENVSTSLNILSSLDTLYTTYVDNQELKKAIFNIADINKEGVAIKRKIKEIDSIDIDLNSLSNMIDNYYSSMSNNQSLKLDLDKLESMNNNLSGVVSNLDNTLDNLSHLDKLDELENAYALNDYLLELIADITSFNFEVNKINQKLALLDTELQEVDKELSEFDVCPYCNSSLK